MHSATRTYIIFTIIPETVLDLSKDSGGYVF